MSNNHIWIIVESRDAKQKEWVLLPGWFHTKREAESAISPQSYWPSPRQKYNYRVQKWVRA